jgi:predicted RNA binding protein YcfA (HicA-like mRNA interferase family)
MTSRELLRKLRHLGASVTSNRGKGGHVRVELDGRVSHVPTGSGELKTGLIHGVLRQLGLTMRDLQ